MENSDLSNVQLDKYYRENINSLVRFAYSHVYKKDEAIDAVHDALIKVKVWLDKNPERKISDKVVRHKVLIACSRRNRKDKNIPAGSYQDLAELSGDSSSD